MTHKPTEVRSLLDEAGHFREGVTTEMRLGVLGLLEAKHQLEDAGHSALRRRELADLGRQILEQAGVPEVKDSDTHSLAVTVLALEMGVYPQPNDIQE